MPGICGIASSKPVDFTGELNEMILRMMHHPWYREERYLDDPCIALGRASLGIVNTAEQPAYNEDRSLVAIMDGEVYDYAKLRRALAAEGHVFQGDGQAELLLHGFERGGKDFFRELNGTFAAAIWDRGRQRLILVNDRFGMKPLYYAELPKRFSFASEIKALLVDPQVSRRINARGLAQFFTFSHLLEEDTLLEGARLLPAAAYLTYDLREERVALERYWSFETKRPRDGQNEATILDGIDEAFKRAVDRRTEGTKNLGLSLSGGLDSRTILAAVDPACPLSAISMGVPGSIDHRAAEQMARLAQRPHHRYMLDTKFLSRFEEYMRDMVHLTDGQYLSQCIVMPTLPVYREVGIEVLLRGHAGEWMHMDKAYNYSLNGDAFALRDEAGLEDWLFGRLRNHMMEDVNGPLLAPALQGDFDALARDSLRSALRGSAGIEPPVHRVWHLFLTQRVRRETALSMVKFGSLMETRLPYVDNDLMDVLMAAPPEMKMGDRIQAYILRRRMPAFLDVVNANTGARLGAGRMARFIAKVKLKVFAKLGVRGYQPYERLGRWLRADLRPLVERLLLSQRCLDRGIFNPSTLKAVVRDHCSGQKNHTYLLMAMMIFEMGQREFIDGDSSSKQMTGGRGAAAPL
jgi:asparagine synthase (glutamine-hydrolysing)